MLFVMFNGESFDYMGSSRFIYDLLNNKWPDTGSDTSSKIFGRLTMDQIKQYIELGQFVNENPSGKTDEDIIGVLHEVSTMSVSIPNCLFSLLIFL